jgi:hypothetical protein
MYAWQPKNLLKPTAEQQKKGTNNQRHIINKIIKTIGTGTNTCLLTNKYMQN